jgi:hypothetical protein
VHRVEFVELIRKEMSIPIHRDIDTRVSEVMLDRLGVDAPADQHGRAGVPQIVNAQSARKSRTPETRPPYPTFEVRWPERAMWERENQCVSAIADRSQMDTQLNNKESGNHNCSGPDWSWSRRTRSVRSPH